jgi:apolipoprotein N-acyltransferase
MRPPVEVSTAPAVMPLPAAFAAAAAGGAVLDGAFPDKNWWPLAFLGIGLILAALPGRRAGAAFSVGLVAGVSFYGFHIQWVALFLGPVPITALVLLQALLFAAGCTAITLAYRWLPQLWPGPWGACLGVPAVVAAVWCAREEVSSTWPYGGFSWGRAAMSQSTSPLRESFAWLGISGVGFVMVLVVAMILQIVSTRALRHPSRWIAPVAAATLLVGLPAWPIAQTGTMRVGAVQGNGPAGYFDDSNPGDLTQAQVDATTPLLDERLDAVLWPEGATDRSPLDDDDTAATFDAIAQATAAPLIGWAITERDGKTYNTEIQWEPGAGPVDFYDKKHPVPFGEYVPDRAFWRSLAPDLVDMVARDYTPGTTDPIFDISGVPVGISICFDIVDDDVLRQSVTEGAQVLFSSSNNADFGRSDQSAQQLAIAQIRAIELGRSVVNISTVGRSAVIAPDGSISKELPWHAPGALIADVPLANSVTPAARWGGEIETALAVLGFGSLIGAFLVLHRPRLTSRSCHRNVP